MMPDKQDEEHQREVADDKYIACPFCNDGEDYDLVGLKDHLTYCEAYLNTEVLPSIMR